MEFRDDIFGTATLGMAGAAMFSSFSAYKLKGADIELKLGMDICPIRT